MSSSAPPGRLERADRAAAGSLVLATALLLLPGVFWELPPAKGVVAARRVLAGDFPYRDFWSMYAPGHFFLGAALLRLAGNELVVLGLATVALRALAAGAAFRILRRVGLARRPAWIAGLALGAVSFEAGVDVASYPPALPAILIAWDLVLAQAGSEPGARRPFAAGLLLGAAACFKHDVAAYAALAAAAALAGGPAPWRPLLLLGGGCATVVLPVAAWLATVAGRDAWVDLIAFPATDFRGVWEESYPGPLPNRAVLGAWLRQPGDLQALRTAAENVSAWLAGSAPILCFALAAALLVVPTWLGARPDARQRAACRLALAGLPCFFAAAHVQRNTHMLSMAILSALVLASLVAAGTRPRRARLGAAPLALALVLGQAIPAGMQGARLAAGLRRGGFPPGRSLPFDGVRAIRVPPSAADTYTRIAGFVRAHTAPDERIHVGLARHDAVVIGNQRFYLLSDRRPATRYNELHGGVTDRAAVQREMIADIERHGVRCMILWRFGGKNPDWSQSQLERIKLRRRERLGDTGAELLDEYIRASYEVLFSHGEYDVLWRRGLPRPEGS